MVSEQSSTVMKGRGGRDVAEEGREVIYLECYQKLQSD